MDVFEVRDRLIKDYREFTGSFVDIHDKAIRGHVADRMTRGYQWPDPWLSLNPNFASGGTVTDLVKQGLLQPECEKIFRLKENSQNGQVLRLHKHQTEAIAAARAKNSYVLTTGTGSGKSLHSSGSLILRVPPRAAMERLSTSWVEASVGLVSAISGGLNWHIFAPMPVREA
jgi:hypothetical protein